MKKYSFIYKNSKSKNLRLYILEHTLLVEETASQTLGYIMNIDWKTSHSIGYSSTALSFNQKIQIIQDIKGLEKIDKQQLQDLMIIRNKFAHVKAIETFEDFFQISNSGKEVKKNLDKWYLGKYLDIENGDEEFKYKVFFNLLFQDVTYILVRKIGEHAQERGKLASQLDFLEVLKDEVLGLPNGNDILKKVSQQIESTMNTYMLKRPAHNN